MNEKHKIVRLSDALYYIIRGRRLIFLLAFAGLVAGIIISGVGYIQGNISKEYRITSSIAIIAQTGSGKYASRSANPEKADVELAQEITDSAIYILKSERTLNDAVEKSDLSGVSITDIQKNISFNQYKETQIIEVTLYWRSESEGIRILNAINSASGEVLLETLKIGNVSIVNSPKADYIVGGSVSMSTWLITALIGALIGMVICVLRLLISPLLTNIKDIDGLNATEVIGNITYDKNFSASYPFGADDSLAKKDIISLAHILENRMKNHGYRKLLLTSTIKGEGKTSLVINIAQQLASSGVKTLMIDADFKNPNLSAAFGEKYSYENTLNAVYFGDADETDAICHITGCLDLLPCIIDDKAISVNEPLLRLINRISDRYDLVLLDCAPVGIDAEVIAFKSIVDTALFVTRYDYADFDDIKKAIDRLSGAGVSIIGYAVNSVKTIKDILKEAQKFSLFSGRFRIKSMKKTNEQKVAPEIKKSKDNIVNNDSTKNKDTKENKDNKKKTKSKKDHKKKR